MSTPALMISIDELLTTFAADAANGSALLALTALIGRLRDPLRDATFWARVGEAMIRNGFAEPGAAVLAAALAHYPQNVELQYLRGNALRVSGRHTEAEEDYRAALAHQPAHRQAALSLAFMLREQGRINAAADVVLALWRRHPDDLDQTQRLIEFLRESGAPAAARAIAAAAVERWPEHARLAATAGELALAFGDFAAAHAALRRAVELDPAQTSAWLRLSYCRRYAAADDPDLKLFERAWHEGPSAQTRICAGFALGKALDDLDDCAAAAAVLREANALARGASEWRVERWQALIERQLREAPLPALAADPQFVPVFIVGLPRTGTTLVATRLARDAAVHDRGELNWIAAMYEHVAAQNALANHDALQSVATLIRTQMRRDDPPARCIIDKNPLNFRFLNLIAALFPNARIVHCRRGGRDTALSLWSQHFAHPDLGFAYDFATIALVQESEKRLMAHWRSTLALPVLDVDYEALVADPAGQLRRVAEFVGLDGSATLGDAAAPDDVITTASVWQARQPVYTQAVGRWQRYAGFLPELTQLFD